VRQEKGLSLIDIVDGRTPDGHPNASCLRIASENHELGSMSQDNLQSYDLSSSTEQYDIPTLQKSHSRISEVRNNNGTSQLHLFLDNSKRTHSIESRIEDIHGNVIKSFNSISTKSSMASLEWNQQNDNKVTVKEGVYIWYVSVDGMLHTSTINNTF